MKKPPLSVVTARGKILLNLQKLTSGKKGDPIAEFSQLSESIISDVKYVLMIDNRVYDGVTGALPFGRTVEIFGTDASGKTAIGKKAGISAQMKNIYKRITTEGDDGIKKVTYEKLDPDSIEVHVLYLDNEQSFTDDNSLMVDGVKADFILGRCDTVAQVFESMERVIKSVEDYKIESDKILADIVKKKKAKAEGPSTKKDKDLADDVDIVPKEQFILVILDTIASTSSETEIDQKWGTQDYSRQAKELKQAFRRMSRQINKHNVCFLAFNQVSDSFALKAKKNPHALPDESDFATSGGRALKFYASQRVFFQKVPKKYRLHPDNRMEDGLLIEIKTTKNRIKKPLRKGRLVLLFGDEDGRGGGYSESYSMLETFVMLGYAKDESGEITFRFVANGITPTTFESTRANPSIESRREWPAFYAQHKADFDRMWVSAERSIFSSENTIDVFDSNEDDQQDEDLFSKLPTDDLI